MIGKQNEGIMKRGVAMKMVKFIFMYFVNINKKVQIMGGESSKESGTAAMVENIIKDYEIIQRVEDKNIVYIQHRQTHDEFILRQFNFTEKKACEDMMTRLELLKRKLEGNEYVVKLVDYGMGYEDGYCSKFYKVFALFEYPQRTLDDEISERRLQKRDFDEKELWSILASCILGLAHLQKKGIVHSCLKSSSILVSPNGNIKIADPFAIAQQSLYETALAKRSALHLYLSPEQVKALSEELISPNVNEFKSDTWSLGMVMLETGLLEYQDDCYRDEWSRVHGETLKYKLNRFGERYSDDLKDMLELMLNLSEELRPDWVQMEQHVTDEAEFSQNNSSSFDLSEKIPQTINRRTEDMRPEYFDSPPVSFIPTTKKNKTPPPLVITTPQYEYRQQESQPRREIDNPHFQTFNTMNSVSNSQNLFGSANPVSSNNFSSHQPPLSTFKPQHTSVVPNYKEPDVKIYASLVSDINFSRPIKNMFPPTSYLTKTKPDENLLMVVSEDDLSEYPSIQFQLSSQQSNQHKMASNYEIGGRKSSLDPVSVSVGIGKEKGEYVEQIYSMGSKYLGNKLNGLRHGQGRFHYQDGGMYDGEWKLNKMDGYGKLYYQSGKLAYQGHWKADQFNGEGVLFNEIPELLLSSFDYNNFEDIDEYWTKYEGNFENDLKQGKGTLYFSNGERLEAGFVSDMVEGEGRFYCLNGSVISGQWRENIKIA